ncbi:cell division protein DivIVA [Trueperella bernardiae]|uniref:Cell division protein DivIVA n=1 Tax=Trueperella bernardiae TaxID=59561 RepID=A0AAW6ZLY9_9ACTO|nr:cell division protein DivIVA [Trueperella bernardiae]MDK8601298.1 cell division protein DivIVA [Trueperella bernardiae]
MTDTFKRVGGLNNGYNPTQVDEFLEQAKLAYAGDESIDIDEVAVRGVAFDWVRKGYTPALVDAALDRLESAFVQRRRAKVMEAEGEEAWLAATYKQAQALYPRLLRPAGERFADADGRGYKKADVDALLERLSEYFAGKAELTSAEVRGVTFGSARGADAYRESVVDVFLDHAVSVLLAVE